MNKRKQNNKISFCQSQLAVNSGLLKANVYVGKIRSFVFIKKHRTSKGFHFFKTKKISVFRLISKRIGNGCD